MSTQPGGRFVSEQTRAPTSQVTLRAVLLGGRDASCSEAVRDAETTLFGSSGTIFKTSSLFFGSPAVGADLNDVEGSLGCRDRELGDDRPDWAPWVEVGCAAGSSRVSECPKHEFLKGFGAKAGLYFSAVAA